MKAQPKILLVDEREDQLERAAAPLREAGYRVTTVTRLGALAPIARAVQPDLMVLAAHAPGFAAVSAVHELDRLNGGAVPCIYLVDAPDPELRRYCLEHGGVDAMGKPFDPAELASRVGAQLRYRRRVARALGTDLEVRGGLRDPVSGAYRRPAFFELVAQERRRSERYGGGFAVIAGTVQAKEGALGRTFTTAMSCAREVVREADCLARVGTSQLAILLPTVSDESLSRVLDRLAARLRVGGVSAKLGAVSFPERVGTPSELLEAAMAGAHAPPASAVGLIAMENVLTVER